MKLQTTVSHSIDNHILPINECEYEYIKDTKLI